MSKIDWPPKIWLLFVIAACTGIIIGWTEDIATRTLSKPATAPLMQDFNNCQYPSRLGWDGCDNTDPCDPAAAAKAGSRDCA